MTELAPEVQAERDRCVTWCERLAVIFEENAAKLRAEGSFTARAIWPPFQLHTYVRPNWERIALEKDNAAKAIRAAAKAIREGWRVSRYEDKAAE